MNKQEIEKFAGMIKAESDRNFLYCSYEEFIGDLEKDDPETIFDLSILCQVNNGNDTETWVDLLKRASDLGSMGAMEQLADLYCIEDDTDRRVLPMNLEEAVRLYKILAPKGNLRAMYQLALYHLGENSPEPNRELAIEYLETVGDINDGLAEYVAGTFATIKDYDRAIKYYKIAKRYGDCGYFEDCIVDKENVMSCYYPDLAYVYYEKGDIENALKYINKGVRVEKDKYCTFLHGLILMDKGDIDAAIRYFKKSGICNANYYLGLIYLEGNKRRVDKKRALQYFEKAAELGFECKDKIEMLKAEVSVSGDGSR